MVGGCREWARANDAQRVGNMGSFYFLSPRPMLRLLSNNNNNLKQTDETIRRSIKFDDEREDLVMDVFVDNAWQRIRPEEAKKVADENPDISSCPKILSAAGISSILKKKNPATGANSVPI